MTALLIHVDEETSREYETLNNKTKQQFAREISLLIKKIASDARSAKLNQLIQEINNGHDLVGIDSELLLRLLPLD